MKYVTTVSIEPLAAGEVLRDPRFKYDDKIVLDDTIPKKRTIKAAAQRWADGAELSQSELLQYALDCVDKVPYHVGASGLAVKWDKIPPYGINDDLTIKKNFGEYVYVSIAPDGVLVPKIREV